LALAVFLLTYVFLAGFKLPWIKLDRTGAALVVLLEAVVRQALFLPRCSSVPRYRCAPMLHAMPQLHDCFTSPVIPTMKTTT
jgi:hypothetical protein